MSLWLGGRMSLAGICIVPLEKRFNLLLFENIAW
jgi:hypothetical protein